MAQAAGPVVLLLVSVVVQLGQQVLLAVRPMGVSRDLPDNWAVLERLAGQRVPTLAVQEAMVRLVPDTLYTLHLSLSLVDLERLVGPAMLAVVAAAVVQAGQVVVQEVLVITDSSHLLARPVLPVVLAVRDLLGVRPLHLELPVALTAPQVLVERVVVVVVVVVAQVLVLLRLVRLGLDLLAGLDRTDC